ncbi:hypothetical protein ChTU502y2012_369g0005, partial [Cryptosporidium hominis]
MVRKRGIFCTLLSVVALFNDLNTDLLPKDRNLSFYFSFYLDNWSLVKLKAIGRNKNSILTSSGSQSNVDSGPLNDGIQYQSSEEKLSDLTSRSGSAVNFGQYQDNKKFIFPGFSDFHPEPCLADPSRTHPVYVNKLGERAINCLKCEHKFNQQTHSDYSSSCKFETCKYSKPDIHLTRSCSNGCKLIFCSSCHENSDSKLSSGNSSGFECPKDEPGSNSRLARPAIKTGGASSRGGENTDFVHTPKGYFTTCCPKSSSVDFRLKVSKDNSVVCASCNNLLRHGIYDPPMSSSSSGSTSSSLRKRFNSCSVSTPVSASLTVLRPIVLKPPVPALPPRRQVTRLKLRTSQTPSTVPLPKCPGLRGGENAGFV